MNYIDRIKHLADLLDRNGFIKQADLLDRKLQVIAQAAQSDMTPNPLASEAPLSLPSNNEDLEVLSRTTFLMLEELRDFFAHNLSKFKYFGENNIKILQSAFDQLTTMYKTLLRNVSQEYDKQQLASYEQHLRKLQKEVDRSITMKLTPIKVKVDKFLLYNEYEHLLKKIERHYDAGLRELQPVLKKARSVREAFANIIQQTSEEIAHADLIENT
jgi:hypothetical protein